MKKKGFKAYLTHRFHWLLIELDEDFIADGVTNKSAHEREKSHGRLESERNWALIRRITLISLESAL